MKTYLLIFLLLLNTGIPCAQELNEAQLEQRFNQLDSMLAEDRSVRETVERKVNAFANEISEFKSKPTLSFFQRRRLESLLKSSQEVTIQLEQVDVKIDSLNKELQLKRLHLIERYDIRLKQIMRELDDKSLSGKERGELLNTLTVIKSKRELLQAKLDLEIRETVEVEGIVLDQTDNAKKIREKADWLKDQETKMRADARALDQIISNLKEEIEVREKMTEFERDLTLFSHRDELTFSQGMTRTFDGGAGNKTDVPNAYLQDAESSQSSILPLFPEISVGKEVTDLDIGEFIKALQDKKRQLLMKADSLQTKYRAFDREAESMDKQDR